MSLLVVGWGGYWRFRPTVSRCHFVKDVLRPDGLVQFSGVDQSRLGILMCLLRTYHRSVALIQVRERVIIALFPEAL